MTLLQLQHLSFPLATFPENCEGRLGTHPDFGNRNHSADDTGHVGDTRPHQNYHDGLGKRAQGNEDS